MKRYNNSHFNQGISAEMMAERWHLDRASLDSYSLESHKRAARATDEGRFHRQILPVSVEAESGLKEVTRDEGIRPDASLDPEASLKKMSTLKTVFKPDGVITAANSSQITDGAAAVLIMERGKAESLGLKPMARLIAFSLAADDPVLMLSAPIQATRLVLGRAGLKLEQIDLIEINEAFASVVLAWQKETNADLACVNVNGGAIALGHPLGASGARLTTTLVHELERTGARYGLQTMCEGGGMANAMIIERL